MFILVNGAFGIGKTTAARLLAESLPGAVIYDPERIGFVLSRLPAFVLGHKRQPEDYQDLGLWRKLIARGARRAHGHARFVIIPMAFTNMAYWEELCSALAGTAPVNCICLVAPLATIEARLHRRAEAEGTDVDSWALGRARECVRAHRNPAFGTPVDAEKPPEEIVAHIQRLVEQR